MTSLIALQVLVWLGLVVARSHPWQVLVWLVPAAIVSLAFVSWRRGEPWGLLLWRRVAFRLGRRRRDRRAADAPWPGLLPALFPDLQVRGGQTRFGQTFGVATWANVAVAAVEIRQGAANPLSSTAPVQLPVDRILTRIRTARIPVQSLAFVTTATGGESQGPSSRLREVFESLGPNATTVATVRTMVAVRLDPYEARDAITARGGGHRGLVATLATLTGLVETELRAEGLSAAAVEPRALVAHLRAGLFEPGEDGPWVQHWDHVTSGVMMHQCAVLGTWRPRDGAWLTPALVRPGPGAVVSVELFPAADRDLRARVWVRHSRAGADSLATAGVGAAAAVRPALGLVPADGRQLQALRATTVLGSGDVPSF